jgi:hypothetical protein
MEVNLFVAVMEVSERMEDDQRGAGGHSPTLGCVPKGLNLIHGPSSQNQVTQQRGQKMSLH